MGEQLSQDAVMELIRSQYPELLPVLGKPGVQDAVFQAVQNNWTPPRLQAVLQATEYYRTTSAPNRAWDILATIDPATASVRSSQYQQKLNNLIAQTGVNPNGEVASRILHDAIVNQWSDTEMRLNLVLQGATATTAAGQAPGAPTGELAAQAVQVHSLATDYGVPLSDQGAIDWAAKLTAGAVNQDAVKGYMIQQAKSLYPGMTGALDSGVTVAQYADPYKQIAARELNINPDDFNLQDTKWNSALSQVDPTTGNKVPLSLDQWQTRVRSDPQYGYDQTQNARTQAAALVTTLGQKFGVTT